MKRIITRFFILLVALPLVPVFAVFVALLTYAALVNGCGVSLNGKEILIKPESNKGGR